MDTEKNKESSSDALAILPRGIEQEMKQSYLDYSMSVIVGRALPDVRDGLKPVHRRILYAMHRTGLMHDKPYRKSAFIVGRTMSDFHPHGDSAIYDSLVRLAQNFSMRYILVDGQGNFGSIDGDNPAAMRYTEARMEKLAEEMLEDIDKRTVTFVPNFDNTNKEPEVLPAKIPNLLINGSSGIAVGMATNIPPHNLSEVVDGTIAHIDNPAITSDELMTYIKGPDFPTGGSICGKSGIISAYRHGRGKVIVRAIMNIEERKDGKSIIVSEIPYMVNKAEMIKQIADLVRDKKLQGISDIRDESDRDGIRIVIELKRDAQPDVLMNQLYSHTRLQVTFGIITVALVHNVPKILSLQELIRHYVEHRKDIVRKRTLFDLNKAQTRAHILEGLLVALKNIDNTIKLIKESKSVDEAKVKLMKAFQLTDEQSVAILDMRLQRLTSLEQEKIKQEHKELQQLIADLKDILHFPQRILDIIKAELFAIKKQFGDARKTILTDEEVVDVNMEDMIPESEIVITLTHSGYIKRLPLETYRQQNRGGKGLIATTTKEEDSVKDIFVANTHSYMLFFTNKGRVHWLKAFYVPEASRQARGSAIVNLIELQQNEQVTAYMPIRSFDKESYLIMVTKNGTVKKTPLEAYSNPRKGGIIAITLDEIDSLIGVALTNGKQEIILATYHGNAVRFKEEDVRPTGRSAQGVKGIKLGKEDQVIGMVVADDSKSLLTVTENGYGKRTKIDEYRLINRGGSGVINIICSERNGNVAAIACVDENDEIMIISKKGITIRTAVSQISTIGRNTQGVRIMNMNNDLVVSVAKIVKEEQRLVS